MPEEQLTTKVKKIDVNSHGLNLSKGFKYQSQDISSYDNVKPTTSNLDKEVERNLKITLPTGKIDKEAEKEFIGGLDEDGIMTMGNLITQGYSYNASKALYENRDKYKDITAQGITKYDRRYPNSVNIAGGLTESILGLPKFAVKAGADLGEWSLKKLGADEERAKMAGDKIRGLVDNIGFGDKESGAYQTTNVVGDLGQLLIPGGQLKLPSMIQKSPKLLNLVTKISSNISKYPRLAKMLQLGGEGTLDTVKFNAINQEYTDTVEMGAGGLLNMVFGAGGEFLSKIGEKVGINGIMNQGKIQGVIDSIKKEGGVIDDFVKWFNERGFKGNKDEIVSQLNNRADNAKGLKDELLSTVDDRFESKETTDILNTLLENKRGIKGQEDIVKDLESLLKEDNKYTLSEMEEILRQLDVSPSNPYKTSQFAEPKANENALGISKLRDKVKTFIENKADELGLGNIKQLNNEIVVSKKAAQGIQKKSLGEQIKEGLSGVTIPAAVLGYLQEGDIGGMLKYGTLAFSSKMLFNTSVRTWLSNKIYKLEGKERVNLTKWLDSNGETALKDADSKVLSRILNEAEGEIKTTIGDIITKGIIEATRVGGVIGGSKLANSVSEN